MYALSSNFLFPNKTLSLEIQLYIFILTSTYKIQIVNISNEWGDITTDPLGIKRIIKKYYQQFYANKFENLNEIDKFLGRQTTKAYSRRNG